MLLSKEQEGRAKEVAGGKTGGFEDFGHGVRRAKI